MAKREFNISHTARYDAEVVDELALATMNFVECGLTSTEIAAAVQAYGFIRAAQINAETVISEGARNRQSDDYQGRMSRGDKRIR
jgi:hypothetical protein